MSEPSNADRPSGPRRVLGLGLFGRLLLGYLTMLAVAAGLWLAVSFAFARVIDEAWIESASERVQAAVESVPSAPGSGRRHNDGRDRPLGGQGAETGEGGGEIEPGREARIDSAALARLERELDAKIEVLGLDSLRGRRGVSDAMRDGEHGRGRWRRLRRGETLALSRGRGRPPIVVVPLSLGDGPATRAAVITPNEHVLRPRLLIALALVVAGAGAWLLARGLSRRILALAARTDAFARGALDPPPPGTRRSGDEIDALAASFDDMAARIRELIAGHKRLLTNVSHELRTPLARLRVHIELLEEDLDAVTAALAVSGDVVAADEATSGGAGGRAAGDAPSVQLAANGKETADPGRGVAAGEPDKAAAPSPAAIARRRLQTIAREVEETAELVADLLVSGRLDLGRGGALQRAETDLAALVERVAARHDARVVDLRPEQRRADRLDLDARLVERALDNLLANARRASGSAPVTVSMALQGEGVSVAVEDEGPGVPEDRREDIFEAFVRLDDARVRDAGGSGLGLHLARQIATAHGGTLVCRDRADGRPGARFELELPLVAAASPGPT